MVPMAARMGLVVVVSVAVVEEVTRALEVGTVHLGADLAEAVGCTRTARTFHRRRRCTVAGVAACS